MAIFNPYPVTYQNPYFSQQQLQQPQPQQPSSPSIIWVQGEAGAKSYMVAPNQTVPLWDSENQIIYMKSADASGMPSIKVIDYSIRGADVKTEDSELFVSRNEFNEQIETLKNEIKKLRPKKKSEEE